MKKIILLSLLCFFSQSTYSQSTGNEKTILGCISGNCENGLVTFTERKVKYVGEFKDGLYHVQGTYTYANGYVKKGLCKEGDFLGE